MDPFHLGVKVVTLLSAAQNAQSPTFATCSLVVPLLPPLGLGPSGADPPTLAFVAILQHTIAFTGLAQSAYAGHSFRRSATTWAARLAPAPRPSSASAVGILTVSGATLTAPPANAMTSPSLPSSVFVTAPRPRQRLVARRGAT
ncbi:hypothetical protein NDA10_003817 [Ustilago hordei]|nr:hypothetical protein NDA10_003817 [Ustilago hordei]